MSFAKALVTGTIVKEPEKRFTPNNLAIASLVLGLDEQTETNIRVSAFGQLAETIASTMAVGDKIVVEGKLQINSFKLPNGKDKKVFEISANAVEKMSAGASNPIAQNSNQNIVTFNQDDMAQDLIDPDEIPF